VTEQEEAGEFDEESEDEGDQVLAVKPWISAVKHMKPSTAPKDNFKVAPQAHMQLKWAHGFRSFDTTNNLFYNENNEAVYCTAGVGVVHDFKSQAQT
jgi:accessory colonization factor AcfC